MTENMKKFLELVSQNKELAGKLNSADKDELIAMAKEQGFELTDADLEPGNELSDDELDAVAGGDKCFCVLGGGGASGGVSQTCACVTGGSGEMSGGEMRCSCALTGSGEDSVL